MSVKQASQNYQKCLDELAVVYKDWIIKRKKAIKLLKEIVKDMDSDEFRGNVTNILSSGVGVAGGAMVIGGLLLGPFTAGASLAVAGSVATVLGGVSNISSDTIAENYALRKCKEADDEFKADQKRSVDLEHAEKQLTSAIVFLQNEAEATQVDVSTLFKSALITKKGLQVFKVVEKTVKIARTSKSGLSAAFGTAAGKVFGKVSGVFAAFGIGFDIWQILSSSKDISNGSKSELGKGIAKHIVEMEKSLNAVQKYFSETYELNY